MSAVSCKLLLIRILLSTFVTTPAVSAVSPAKAVVFELQGKKIIFSNFPERNILISSSCVENNLLKQCDASKAIKMLYGLAPIKDFLGRNPGAVACSQKLDGKVIWLQDRKGNERTFCRFPDASYLSSGTLNHYLRHRL